MHDVREDNMNGKDDCSDGTFDMMASGYDNIFPMPGDGSYQCPKCGRVSNRDDYGGGAGSDKGVVRCPECGKVIQR